MRDDGVFFGRNIAVLNPVQHLRDVGVILKIHRKAEVVALDVPRIPRRCSEVYRPGISEVLWVLWLLRVVVICITCREFQSLLVFATQSSQRCVLRFFSSTLSLDGSVVVSL